MTQRTKSALATQVSTLAADNTAGDISASDVRSLYTDYADSLVGGPASATDNTLPRFDSTTGMLMQGSSVVVDDSDNVSGVGTLACGATTITGAAIITANVTADGTIIFNNAAADSDFTVNKNTSGTAIIYDAGNDTLGLNSATTTLTGAITGTGGNVILNNGAGDFDLTVNKDSSGVAILYNAGADTLALDAVTTSIAGDVAVTGGIISTDEYVLGSVGNALTAAGTTRADALALVDQVNNVTTAAASTGIILPVGQVGMQIIVENAGANLIQVYAAGSETIDGVAATTGVPLTNALRCMYFFVAANTWISAQLGVVSA